MTKEIRLLTGRHAGARIKFNPTLMRIGNDREAEIQISDWDQPTMQLSQHDDGSLTIARASDSGEPIALVDFKPHRFGNVVLCAGDADGQWPTDIALLETLLAPAPTPEPESIVVDEALPATPFVRPKNRRNLHAVGVAGVALLAIGGAGIALPAVLHPRMSGAQHGAAPQPSVDQLQRALDRLHQADVAVTPQGGRFIVVGVVPDSTSETLVRTTLETIAPDRIVWRIGCIDQIARDLQESLHDPALQVHYLGHREFGVSGVAKDTHAVQTTLAQMSADLAPMVIRVAQQVTPDDRMAMPTSVASLLAVDDLQYVEADDGTKQFIDSRAAAHPLN
ncbi:HrpD5 family protein [Trinickia acidisoli]|uniref:HrpD5 family protein n=1 Tax=Trinickia acidisoli TaxID=2767482 RepID=UPI001A8DD67E|nr:HrpD5 family protein [Trinickia acidisoli]